MKKLLAMVLSLTMVIFSLVGCSKPAEEEKKAEEPKTENTEYVDGLLKDFEASLMKQIGDEPEKGKNEK